MNVRINKVQLIKFKGDIEEVSKDFQYIILSFAAIAIISTATLSIMMGVKALLIFLLSVFVARESEIFFLTQKMSIPRSEAKAMLKTTRPETTGLIFAMLLPVGTPLFVVAVGSFVSIFVGKMIFGGYSFNIFNPAIVGRLFVGISWPALVTVSFPNIMDNYILKLIFHKDLSSTILSPLEIVKNSGVVSGEHLQSISQLLLSPHYGMLFAIPSIFYILVMVHFVIRKTIDFRPFLYTFAASLLVLVIISNFFNLDSSFITFNIFSGGFLFVTLFMMSDPFTKPTTDVGILYYAVIFTVVFTLIRFLGTGADGVLYALLFSNIFVPLLNKKNGKKALGLNGKTAIMIIILLLILSGTGLFINKILSKRLVDKAEVVSIYDQK